MTLTRSPPRASSRNRGPRSTTRGRVEPRQLLHLDVRRPLLLEGADRRDLPASRAPRPRSRARSARRAPPAPPPGTPRRATCRRDAGSTSLQVHPHDRALRRSLAPRARPHRPARPADSPAAWTDSVDERTLVGVRRPARRFPCRYPGSRAPWARRASRRTRTCPSSPRTTCASRPSGARGSDRARRGRTRRSNAASSTSSSLMSRQARAGSDVSATCASSRFVASAPIVAATATSAAPAKSSTDRVCGTAWTTDAGQLRRDRLHAPRERHVAGTRAPGRRTANRSPARAACRGSR